MQLPVVVSLRGVLVRARLVLLRALRRLIIGPVRRETFPGRPFHAFLEAPRVLASASRPLTLSGWIVSTRVPIARLTLKVGTAPPEPLALRARRPDVGQIFPDLPAAATCGFRRTLLVPPGSIPSGGLRLEIRAVLEDGTSRRCFAWRVRVEPPKVVASRTVDSRGDAARRRGSSSRGDLAVLPADWRSQLARALAGARGADQPPAEVECSIIIPVFERAGFTWQCLRSLLAARVSASFEVVVVDNGSGDATTEVLDAFGERIRVVRNSANEGFVVACNQGAHAARGRHLVFLNNDTEVTDGWLDHLLATVRTFDSVGAVGAKLLYPGGVLQEAGGIVYADASAANYGRYGDPDGPAFAFLREVDYCSAACLLVPTQAFAAVGGLDEAYSPGYYEDTDLCFALRERGLKVLYQPRCEVVHVEGGTAGTDLSQGAKVHQEVNRGTFARKWALVLPRQQPFPPSEPAAGADRRTGPRILFIDYQIPRPDEDSGSFRIVQVVTLLAQMGCRVAFLLPAGAPFDAYCRALGGVGVEVLEEEIALAAVASAQFDLAVLSRVEIGERYVSTFKQVVPTMPVVFDTVDLHFLREQREAELRADGALARLACVTREQELAVARAADLTLTVTEADRAHLLALDPALQVAVLPNIHPVLPPGPGLTARTSLMFIGGFAHPPNRDAALYLVAEVLPEVRRELGDVELLLVGSKPPQEVLALASPSIVVTGKVPHAAPFYDRSRVVVAPLRYGAGMKGKIGEALSHGVPVVTTTIGAEGMGLLDGETVLIGDDPRAFAVAVARVWRDAALWEKLSRQGKQHVEEHFSPARVRPLVERLHRLACVAAARSPRATANGPAVPTTG